MPVATRGESVIALLPPSEGKSPIDAGPPWDVDDGAFGTALAPRRREVVDALRRADGGDVRLLGVRGEHLARARAANLGLLGAGSVPAWRRYTGVVWDHLDPATLRAVDRRRALVVSGLLGLVRADDPVPDYRLKIGASLPPLGKLSTWWRPALTDALVATAARRFVVDLLPNEHRAALDLVRLGAATRRRDGRSGGCTVVLRETGGASGGHGAKAAKGRLARHLLDAGTGIDPIEVLRAWRDEAYVVDITPW